jgi:hypothetical protein
MTSKPENSEEETAPPVAAATACSPCRDIGNIGNYYGGLSVKMEDGKCYWAIENYDGNNWDEIPRSLFDALNKYQDDSEANTQPSDH